MDCFSKEKRSVNMSKIRSIGTTPEQRVISWLKNKGYCFKTNSKGILGKPDIVFYDKKIIIFIHGCFWHHHKKCTKATLPKTNKKYWLPKIENNVKRDRYIARKLRECGWHVLTVWECQLNKGLDKYLNRIEKSICAELGV